MHPTRINNSCKRPNRRTIYAGSQSVGEVRNQQLSHSLMTGLQMDEHIARIALNQGATPQVKTYLTDALGSVITTAKADQSLEVGYAFSPYGQTQKVGVENQVAGSENSNQYTGRENDNNGLYFYRARYYDPILKRFISEDPIGLAGGINSHAYVEGNPISYIDPDGLSKNRGGGRNGEGITPYGPGYSNGQYYPPLGGNNGPNTREIRRSDGSLPNGPPTMGSRPSDRDIANGVNLLADPAGNLINGITGQNRYPSIEPTAPDFMQGPEKPVTGGMCRRNP
jgi:RHS repeat-associated protein